METTDVNNPNCVGHSEAIATIVANTTAIREHLARLNGSVAKHEEAIAELKTLVATHVASQEAYDEETKRYRSKFESWKKRVCDDMEQMKEERAETRGKSRGALGVVREAVSVVLLIMTIWMAYSSHQQTMAAQSALQQQIQKGTKP